VNIPLDELRERLREVDHGRRIIAYCHVGQRGYFATRILSQAGYDVANLSGGYVTYCQSTAFAKPRPSSEATKDLGTSVTVSKGERGARHVSNRYERDR
jgi:hypothetical protein